MWKMAQTCQICHPLTACTEDLVMIAELQQSVNDGCPICGFFSQVVATTTNVTTVDYVSSWSAAEGVFGIYIAEREPEDGPRNDEQASAGKAVVLAANGG